MLLTITDIPLYDSSVVKLRTVVVNCVAKLCIVTNCVIVNAIERGGAIGCV